MYTEAGFQFPFFLAETGGGGGCFPQEASTMMMAASLYPYELDQYASAVAVNLPVTDEDLLARFDVGLQDCGAQLINILQAPIVSGYDLGGEGDLFKAPEPVTEESVLAVDPMAAAMSIISRGEHAIAETIKAADIESIHSDHLSDVYYECKKEFLEKLVIEEPISEMLETSIPTLQTSAVSSQEQPNYAEGTLQKSVSSECLQSLDWLQGCMTGPRFLDFQGLVFAAAFGMRRAYSEGDIQNLGNKRPNIVQPSTIIHSSLEQLLTISDLKTEERRQKLSRYWKKKSQRNFGRKIKYACRKALADTQPRVRGRFAKTQDSETSKRNKPATLLN